MTHTQHFIELAVKGDYEGLSARDFATENYSDEAWAVILLDPLAWQAVGKVKGWPVFGSITDEEIPGWKEYWHNFIDHLAEGKSIEEALGEILK